MSLLGDPVRSAGSVASARRAFGPCTEEGGSMKVVVLACIVALLAVPAGTEEQPQAAQEDRAAAEL